MLAVFGVILSVVLMAVVTEGGINTIGRCLDWPSLLLLLVVTIPVLFASGLAKDFNRSFVLSLKKKKGSLIELKRARDAVQLVRKILMYGGLFIALYSIIILMGQINDPAALGPNLAVAIVVLLYAVALNLILLPIQARLEIKMAEYMQE